MSLVTQFLETITRESVRKTSRSQIKKYLEWRDATYEEVFKNGLKEEEHFDRFLEEDMKMKYSSKRTRVGIMKQSLRFHGIPFVKFSKMKKELRFIEDQAMQDYLMFVGNARNTQREANRALGFYCEYRKLTPTELIEEAQENEITDIRLYIMRFYKSLGEIKSAWKYVSYVKRFYNYLCNMIISLPKQKNGLRKLNIEHSIVDKELIRQFLSVADIRDAMVIFACFESGMNPVDLVSFNYGKLKKFLDMENPEEVNDCAVVIHTRQKTNCEFIACFGKQTLQYMSKFLKQRQEGYLGWDEEITDESPIFSSKRAPYGRLNAGAISEIFRRLSKALGIEPIISEDFRNSFNTRAKQELKHYDKEIFMGHTGGIERHYDVSKIEYFQDEYRKAWEVLFDLTRDDARYDSLELENRAMRKELHEMREQINSIGESLGDAFDFLDEENPELAIDDLDLDETINFFAFLKYAYRKALNKKGTK